MKKNNSIQRLLELIKDKLKEEHFEKHMSVAIFYNRYINWLVTIKDNRHTIFENEGRDVDIIAAEAYNALKEYKRDCYKKDEQKEYLKDYPKTCNFCSSYNSMDGHCIEKGIYRQGYNDACDKFEWSDFGKKAALEEVDWAEDMK